MLRAHDYPAVSDLPADSANYSLDQAREDDVFVCTFVKAGTTWTQMILKLLLSGGEEDGRRYSEIVPWLEALTSDVLAPREAPGHSLASVAAAPGPRYFKTHAHVRHLPGSLASGAKVIYVARNPKDTAVSLFHHAQNKPEFGYDGDFDTFFRIFLAGRAENGCWFDHVLDWHSKSVELPGQVLFLQYEDMVDDPETAVCSIARFIGLGGSPDIDATIRKTVVGSTISSMKNNPAANIGMGHLRQGGYGGWRDVFTVAQNDSFDKVYAARMQGSRLSFKFGLEE
eukprot:CAMPEP_0117677352 /NCGR_PEP_ID=MMETSP0804-20121206/16699_1 /TAXON_ID=1074897 /ORGANISM="Tetraselmis astigmatica, Strain CCMP880" /LENGTH=283 /DNA_ID=CAMNT_0005486629 /DNA_START=430 /DNA_END=1282 /DNA_ORIENTATION=-